MANIKITEIDETTAGLAAASTDIVYVPGFVTQNPDYYDASTLVGPNIPTLCTTLADFESCFGVKAATFTANQEYPEGFDVDAIPTGYMCDALSDDKSYIFAKELINLGIPVLYERMNGSSPDGKPLAPSVQELYDKLVGTDTVDVWNTLKDKGEYSVKYLTTGGYPSFEFAKVTYDMSKFTGASEDSHNNFRYAEVVKSTFVDACETLIGGEGVTTLANVYTLTVTGEDTWTMVYGPDDSSTPISNAEIKAIKGDNDVYSLQATISEKPPIQLGITFTIMPGTTLATGSFIKITLTDGPKGSIIAAKMLDCASSRGDCVALIDHTDNPSRSLNPVSVHSVYHSISDANSTFYISSDAEFGAMFTPWCSYNCVKTGITTYMPASFGYLTALAKSIRTNANWLAIAGASRGIVPNFVSVHSDNVMSNAIADAYQPRNAVSINPITNIKPYGYTIWGNRTLKNNGKEGNLTATSFLNVRNLVSDVKKVVYTSAKRCLFEQNNDILWIRFKSLITPTLDKMVSGYGLSGYKIIKGTTTEKAKLVADIKLYPIYAVEDFDITVFMSDDEVRVS